MSAESMIAAFEAAQTDARLTTLEKLLLLRVAWKTRPGAEYQIRYKTLARELSASRNGVKRAVRRLEALGYLYTVAVNVRLGPALLGASKGSLSDPPAQEEGGHSVTPEGSLSDPQRGRSVTPLQRKDKNKRAKAPCEARKAKPHRLPLDSGGAAMPRWEDLSEWQRSQVRAGRPVNVKGVGSVGPEQAAYVAWSEQHQRERAA